MGCISVVRSLYFRIFLASYLNTFPSPEIAASINIHIFVLSRIMLADLLLLLLLSSSSSSRYFVYEPKVKLFPTCNITVVIAPNSYAVITAAIRNTGRCSPAQ
jgi:hypothetical protein